MKAIMTFVVLALAMLASSAPNGARAQDDRPDLHRHTITTSPQQDWQVRRGEFLGALNIAASGSGDERERARARVAATVEKLKADPLALTPMEAMDVHGAILIPGSGEANMTGILAALAGHATLGWYDALRFTDDSGRAEIADNEKFFVRALLMSDGGARRMVDFLATHALESSQAVRSGVEWARSVRDNVRYDRHWPSAYGLAPMLCRMSVERDTKDCALPISLPADAWNAAFDEAAAFVTHYYRKN